MNNPMGGGNMNNPMGGGMNMGMGNNGPMMGGMNNPMGNMPSMNASVGNKMGGGLLGDAPPQSSDRGVPGADQLSDKMIGEYRGESRSKNKFYLYDV